jgi:hypothetical protein
MISSDLLPAVAVMSLCIIVFYFGKRVEWAYEESKEKSDGPQERYTLGWFEWEGKIKSYAILVLGFIFSIYILFN